MLVVDVRIYINTVSRNIKKLLVAPPIAKVTKIISFVINLFHFSLACLLSIKDICNEAK